MPLKDPEKRRQYMREYRKKNLEKVRAYYRAYQAKWRTVDYAYSNTIKRKYGITLIDYKKMLQDQGGVCAICGSHGKPRTINSIVTLCVDHDHESGAVRKLLCNNCNAVLGHSKDRIDTLESCIEYLKEHGK